MKFMRIAMVGGAAIGLLLTGGTVFAHPRNVEGGGNSSPQTNSFTISHPGWTPNSQGSSGTFTFDVKGYHGTDLCGISYNGQEYTGKYSGSSQGTGTVTFSGVPKDAWQFWGIQGFTCNQGEGNGNSWQSQGSSGTWSASDAVPGCPAIKDSLTIDYVGNTTKTVTVKVSGLVPSDSNTTPIPNAVQFFEAPPGTQGPPSFPKWQPIGLPLLVGSNGTETFSEPIDSVSNYNPKDVLGVVEYQNVLCPIATDSTYVPLSPLPFGQLPEVPLAAGIPLVGLGAAAIWWKRRVG